MATEKSEGEGGDVGCLLPDFDFVASSGRLHLHDFIDSRWAVVVTVGDSTHGVTTTVRMV